MVSRARRDARSLSKTKVGIREIALHEQRLGLVPPARIPLHNFISTMSSLDSDPFYLRYASVRLPKNFMLNALFQILVGLLLTSFNHMALTLRFFSFLALAILASMGMNSLSSNTPMDGCAMPTIPTIATTA